MRILITGAAGFLGSHLCDRFITEGHEVIGLDNLLTGRLENLDHLKEESKFSFIEHDVTRPIIFSPSLDGVIHFASPASPNPTSPFSYPSLPIETMKAGSIGTFNALDLAKEKHAKFLFASSSEIYGDPLEHPQNESYWGHVDPIGKRSVYDETKRFSESLIMAYNRLYKLDTRIVRIFNTYGPRMRLDDGRVVPNFIFQAIKSEPLTIYGDGSQTRSFCYISDLIEGIYRLFLSYENLPVNLGNPIELTILEFAQIINNLTGNSSGVEYREGMFVGHDPQRRRPDIGRAKKVLDWEPIVTLENGLKKTIEYFREEIAAL